MRELFEKLVKCSAEDFYHDMKSSLIEQKRMFIVTANPETFMIAQQKQGYYDMLMKSETVMVPDGIGIVKVANHLKFPVKERIPGIEIAERLLEYADELQLSLCLLGAKPEVLQQLLNLLKSKYKNIKLLQAEDGYQSNKDEIMESFSKLQPDILLIALGIPAQETLIYRHLDRFSKGILVGVGGSFDVISGSKKRAPKLFVKLNLEWLYRIAKEPSRLKRFYNNNIRFLKMAKKMQK